MLASPFAARSNTLDYDSTRLQFAYSLAAVERPRVFSGAQTLDSENLQAHGGRIVQAWRPRRGLGPGPAGLRRAVLSLRENHLRGAEPGTEWFSARDAGQARSHHSVSSAQARGSDDRPYQGRRGPSFQAALSRKRSERSGRPSARSSAPCAASPLNRILGAASIFNACRSLSKSGSC